jgi:hypothetical protein
MTSLEELCRTEDEKEIATKLAQHEILTDRDLLIADETAVQRCGIPNSVPEPQHHQPDS